MIVGISGSATPQSSTDILIKEILSGTAGDKKQSRFYRLNEMRILPCQACGKSPEPDLCFFHDDAHKLLDDIARAQIIVFGSPVYFDSVSAQAKLFIDRSNCIRPANFANPQIQSFKEPLFKGKTGGLLLVAGDYGRFDSALRTMRAFFLWAGIEIKFELTFKTKSLNSGEAGNNPDILEKAFQIGKSLRP